MTTTHSDPPKVALPKTANEISSDGGAMLPEQTYTTGGTYTWKAPISGEIAVQCWGGGGGGDTDGAGGGGWGGGGGGCAQFLVNVTAGASYTVVVGKGGAGGQVSNPYLGDSPGQSGGQSYFSGGGTTYGSAQGGGGADGSAGAGGGGTGSLVYSGGSGGALSSLYYGSGGGGGAGPLGAGGGGAYASAGGAGGLGGLGGGGAGGAGGQSDGASGANGTGPGGGGGGGALNSDELPSGNGGNGADGEVIICPTNIYSQDQEGANDTLVWNPICGCMDASNPANWYDQTIGEQLGQNDGGAGSGTPIILDGTSNSQTPDDSLPINWDRSFTVPSMTLQNSYIAQQTLAAGITLELAGDNNGVALNMDKSSDLNQNLGPNTKSKYDGDAQFFNFNITGDPTSQVVIERGTSTMASDPGFTENLGVPLLISKGATLNYQSFNTLNLTAANLVITVNGEMDAFWGTGSGSTLIQGAADDYIDVSGGTLKYIGNTGVEDTIAVPVLVENSGNFTVTSSSGGWLIVKGQTANTMKYSVYMTSGSVNLSEATTLECDDDYRQDGGTLQTTDSSNCGLQDGPENALSTALINGGSLTINGGASSGTFNVYAANLNFAGTLVVGIQGNTAGQNGLLNVLGSMNLQGKNLLTVPINGNLNNGKWTIITTGGNNIAQFAASTLPATLTGHNNVPKAGAYQVTSP